jgi:ribosomal protein S27AE
MTPQEAVRKLINLGYRFEVAGERIRYHHDGPIKPDLEAVRPLLETVKAHKPDVVHFLKSYCPRCGGVVFGTFSGVEHCLACYHQALKNLLPELERRH